MKCSIALLIAGSLLCSVSQIAVGASAIFNVADCSSGNKCMIVNVYSMVGTPPKSRARTCVIKSELSKLWGKLWYEGAKFKLKFRNTYLPINQGIPTNCDIALQFTVLSEAKGFYTCAVTVTDGDTIFIGKTSCHKKKRK